MRIAFIISIMIFFQGINCYSQNSPTVLKTFQISVDNDGKVNKYDFEFFVYFFKDRIEVKEKEVSIYYYDSKHAESTTDDNGYTNYFYSCYDKDGLKCDMMLSFPKPDNSLRVVTLSIRYGKNRFVNYRMKSLE